MMSRVPFKKNLPAQLAAALVPMASTLSHQASMGKQRQTFRGGRPKPSEEAHDLAAMILGTGAGIAGYKKGKKAVTSLSDRLAKDPRMDVPLTRDKKNPIDLKKLLKQVQENDRKKKILTERNVLKRKRLSKRLAYGGLGKGLVVGSMLAAPVLSSMAYAQGRKVLK